MRRVNESVRAVVAEGVGELKDPRIGMVTVTGVVVTPDLREATVYVSVLGGEKKRRATMAGLESAHGVLQSQDQPRAQPAAHADDRVLLR